MTIGRAEIALLADVIDAQQRALGRPLTRQQMSPAIALAEETAVEAMRESEAGAFQWAVEKAKAKRARKR